MSVRKFKFDTDKDWTNEKNKAAARGDLPGAAQAERNHNDKIDYLGLDYPKTYDYIDLGTEIVSDIQNGKDPKKVYEKTIARQNKALGTPGLSQYAYDPIQEQAMRYYTEGMSKRPTYENKRQTTIDELWSQVMNPGEFSYDVESDPVFQSYKDQYTREGQRAMEEMLADLSIDAGGENSWAVSAAAQAQNRYMQELADKVPELYSLAYERYLNERNADTNKLALAMDMENADYNKYLNEMNIFQNDRTYNDAQFDKWQNQADKHALEAQNQVQNYINAGEMPPDEVLEAAGLDKAWVSVMVEDAKKEREYNDIFRDYDLKQLMTPTVVKGTVINPERQPLSADEYAAQLDEKVEKGELTQEEADALYEKYVNGGVDGNPQPTTNTSYIDMVDSTIDWSVEDDGGTNWWWGLDNNAILQAPNGEKIRIDVLYDKLQNEGLTAEEAKKKIKDLQKNLGV